MVGTTSAELCESLLVMEACVKSGTLAIVTVGPFPAAVCSIAPSGVLTVIVHSPVVVVVLWF